MKIVMSIEVNHGDDDHYTYTDHLCFEYASCEAFRKDLIATRSAAPNYSFVFCGHEFWTDEFQERLDKATILPLEEWFASEVHNPS